MFVWFSTGLSTMPANWYFFEWRSEKYLSAFCFLQMIITLCVIGINKYVSKKMFCFVDVNWDRCELIFRQSHRDLLIKDLLSPKHYHSMSVDGFVHVFPFLQRWIYVCKIISSIVLQE